MRAKLYVIIEMDLENNTAHCFNNAYEEWDEAVSDVLEETGMTDEGEIKTLEVEGYAETDNRKFFIETVHGCIHNTW